MSLEETNRIRVSMGLRPLVPRPKKEEPKPSRDQKEQAEETQRDQKEKDEKKVSARELLERLEASKKRRGSAEKGRDPSSSLFSSSRNKKKGAGAGDEEERVVGKSIADEVDESELDIVSWVKQSRANQQLEEEKRKAQMLQKKLDEEEMEMEQQQQGGRGGGGGGSKRKQYGVNDLTGLHILHSADKFGEGETILTLADVPLLDKSGSLVDQPDMLISSEIAAEERREKLIQRTKKGYDAVKELEEGRESRSILSKYDRLDEEMNEDVHNADITSIGKHRPDKMMIIQSGNAVESDHEKIVTLRSRLNRISTIVPVKAPIVHYLPDTDGPLPSAPKPKINAEKLSFTLDSQPLKVAEDFMSLEEAASRSQFRRKASKRSSSSSDPQQSDQPRQRRRQLRSQPSSSSFSDESSSSSSSSSDTNTSASPFAAPSGLPPSKRSMNDDNDGDDDDDHRSRSDTSKIHEDRIRRTQQTRNKQSAYNRAIEIANKQTRSLLIGDEAESAVVSDDSDMYEKMSRSRHNRVGDEDVSKARSRIRLDPLSIIQRIQTSHQSHLQLLSDSPSQSAEDFLILAPTIEFTRNIKVESEDINDDDDKDNTSMSLLKQESDLDHDMTGPNNSDHNGNGHGNNHDDDDDDGNDGDGKKSREDPTKGRGIEEIFGEEDLASGSISAAISLLRTKMNPMAEDSRVYAGRKKDERPSLDNDPAPHLDLSQRDEFGRVLTTKEAFRRMCYKFHGHTPSKNTMEKLRRREEQDRRRLNMNSTDTPLNTVERMKREQERTSLPFVLVGGSKKSDLLSSSSSSSSPSASASSLQKNRQTGSSSSSRSASGLGVKHEAQSSSSSFTLSSSSQSQSAHTGYFASFSDPAARGSGAAIHRGEGGGGFALGGSKLQFNISGVKRKREDSNNPEQTPASKRLSLFAEDEDEDKDSQTLSS